jgi:hypothetical protein
LASIANNAITGNSLATNAITLGYAEITSGWSTTSYGAPEDITGLAVTVTVPSGGRRIKITGFAPIVGSSVASANALGISEGATQLNYARQDVAVGSPNHHCFVMCAVIPTAGAHTYKLTLAPNTAGTHTVYAAATSPAFILVELI